MWTLPNILTLCNLFAGLMGIYFVMAGQPFAALMAIAISLCADYLDGMTARLLHTKQLIGKDLDSLADIVSFGALPSFMLLTLFREVSIGPPQAMIYLPFSSFLFTVFGALRLAKFNQEQRSADHFFGLPIPAAATYLAGLYWLHHSASCLHCATAFINPLVLSISLIMLCALMISDLPHFHLKLNAIRWKGHEIRWIFIILVLPLVLLLKQVAIPFSIVLYIFLSLIFYARRGSAKP